MDVINYSLRGMSVSSGVKSESREIKSPTKSAPRVRSAASRGKLVLNSFIIMTKSQVQKAEDVIVANLASMNMEDIDTTDFEKFCNLVELDCSENPKLPFHKLGYLESLKQLSFCGNNLGSISFEKGFVELETLDLSYNFINKKEDIMLLGDLKSLRNLILAGNDITEFPNLPDNLFKALRALDLEGNQVNDQESFSALANLPRLRALNLKRNHIRRFKLRDDCRSFPSLKELYMNDNLIDAVDPIVDVNRIFTLKKLILINNPIVNNDYMLSSELYKLTESNKADVFCFEERDRTTGMTLTLPKLKRIGLKTRWNRFQVSESKYVSPIAKPVTYAFPLEETLKDEDENANTNGGDDDDDENIEISDEHIEYMDGDNMKQGDGGFFITGVNVEGGLLPTRESPISKNLSRDDDDILKAPEIPPGQIPISEAYKLLKKALDLGYEEVPMKKDVSRVEKLLQIASLNANVPLTHLDPDKDYCPPKQPKNKKVLKKKSDIKIMNEVIEEVDKRLNIIEFNIGNVMRKDFIKKNLPSVNSMVKEVQAEYERLHSLLVPENIPTIPPNTILHADKPGFSFMQNVSDTMSLLNDQQITDNRNNAIIQKIREEMSNKKKK